MTMHVLVVDDQPMARERLLSLLRAEPDVHHTSVACSGSEAVEAIQQSSPDLVFLDLQMPELDGFGVVEAIGVERMPPTVFVTAYDEYAVKAFEVQALDYLLKPFARRRFQSALQRVRRHLERERSGALADRLAALLRTGRPPGEQGERLMVKRDGRVVFIDVDHIDWIEAEGNYIRIHTPDGPHVMRETMAALMQRLGERRFFRIHRSRIVNLSQIAELQVAGGGDYHVLLSSGARLGLSRLYVEALKERLRAPSLREDR
jgi:two-component system, LytTR family, response regulator